MSGWVRHIPKMDLPRYERGVATTSYHEAAHTLFCLVMGIPIKTVDVIPRGERLGIVRLKKLNKSNDQCIYRNDSLNKATGLLLASWAFAGMQAELIFNDIRPDGLLLINDSDTADALHYLSVFDADLIRYQAWKAQRLAAIYLADNWSLVSEIALLLTTHKSINGKHLRNLTAPDIISLLSMVDQIG